MVQSVTHIIEQWFLDYKEIQISSYTAREIIIKGLIELAKSNLEAF